MQEIDRIWLKYEEGRLLDRLESLGDINDLALTFGWDVSQTLALITLTRDPGRYSSGFGLSDAPVVGLLTRVAKLLRLVCSFYELGNAEYLSVFSRPLVESAVVATYLLRKGDEAVQDFRRCSHKDTLRILREHEGGSAFFDTPAGQRVLRSARADLAVEGLSKDSFARQKRNRWRLQGKSMFAIFAEVASADEYPFVYGMMSESLHSSWNESMDWCLRRNDDGTFSAYSPFVGVDARTILPLVRYAAPPYALWIDKCRLQEDTLRPTLDRIQDYARIIYVRFDELYDGPTANGTRASDPD